jgi:hypothetical protein
MLGWIGVNATCALPENKKRVIARYEAIPDLQSKVKKNVAYPLLAAGGPVTFVATKVTKTERSEIMSTD